MWFAQRTGSLAVVCFWLLLFGVNRYAEATEPSPSVAGHASIQAALDAHPHQMVFVPAGDYPITEKIRIRGERAGLFGPGRIIQHTANQPIIEIENASGAEIRDLTLTRPEGQQETENEGVLAILCPDLVIENVRVINNRTRSGAITLRQCSGARISRCLIRNYMRVSVDDRMANLDWGYAFRCTDGTGISAGACTGTLIEANRIIEETYTPSPENKTKFKLGEFVKKNPVKGLILSQQVWDANYTDNWQQGSAIIVTSPEASRQTRIISNHIENAAQGIDLHSDSVIVANNVVTNSFMGLKAMHGSRNVLITGNQFIRNSLWAIGLMPGVSSKPGNSDGGSVISHNIISEFGYGDAHWIWGSERSPLRFDSGQEADDPPVTNVLIQGNLVDGPEEKRYRFAVIIASGSTGPVGLHFSGNLLPPGTEGVSNTELPQ